MDTKTLCLGALSLGEASGYEIKKRFEEGPLAHFNRVAFGSIYPALRDLEREGLIETRDEPQDGRPGKRTHRLTAQGKLALAKAVEGIPPPDQYRSDFLFMLFFSDLLTDARLERLIETRRQAYAEKIEAMQGCLDSGCIDTPGHRMVHGFGLALYRAAFDYLTTLSQETAQRHLPPSDAAD